MGNNSTRLCFRKKNVPIAVKNEKNSFRILGGRRFHNEDETSTKYVLPCDLEEQDRLTLQHYLLRYVWQSNFSAPVDGLLRANGSEIRRTPKVLDVGCGTGIWLLEMASEYPEAKFYGIDIVPIFPREIKPSNVTFQLANVIEGIPFPDETFDYVFMRFMCLSFTEEQWREKAIKETLRVTKVGGYVEFFNYDIKYSAEGPNIARVISSCREFSKRRGINPDILPEIPKMLEETGKLKLPINVERIDIPIGSWAGRVGEMMRQNAILAWNNAKVFLPQAEGISVEEFEELLQRVFAEFEIVKPYQPFGRAYSRKISSS